MIQGSSRFVYKWAWQLQELSGFFSNIESFPLIFISEFLMKKINEKNEEFEIKNL